MSLGVLLVLYLFKPQPKRQAITTAFLWAQTQLSSQGGKFAKRLPWHPLMLIQALVLLALVLVLAGPSLPWKSLVPKADRVVIVIDRSASMVIDGAFETAKTEAGQALDLLLGRNNSGLSGRQIMLVAVDSEPQILAPFSSDSASLKQALDSMFRTDVPADLETLRPFLAGLIRDHQAQIWFFGDRLPAELELPGLQFTACRKAVEDSNVAITGFAITEAQTSSGNRPTLFATVTNLSASAQHRTVILEKLSLDRPDRIEALVLEQTLHLPSGKSETLNRPLPASHFSPNLPTLFRLRVEPLSTMEESDPFPTDDRAYLAVDPFGTERLRLSLSPGCRAPFLLRALQANATLELIDWSVLERGAQGEPVDLLICQDEARLPNSLKVRSIIRLAPEPEAEQPSETLLGNPSHDLVHLPDLTWENQRVVLTSKQPVGPQDRILLSTKNGPALVLKTDRSGKPTLHFRFPLERSSLPLSPVLPIIVGRFLDSQSLGSGARQTTTTDTAARLSRPTAEVWRGELALEALTESARASFPPRRISAQDNHLPRLTQTGIYRLRPTAQKDVPPLLIAVNLRSSQESPLTATINDWSSSADRSQDNSAHQEREPTRPLAWPFLLLAFLLLLWEGQLFLHRGRP